ncbi:FAD/NAD(P)-binding protein [Salinicoccus sp. HZC-1]|uniref:FAD/NAD(P)-binding protein n=1 Tax=Salinicoccus sp. HZC-1 TaxID=3385497 RepID=UPI00398B3371
MKIAIIGGGVTGTSILEHIVSDDRYTESIEVDLYDTEELAGKGPAYRADSKHLIINIPSGQMSLSDEDNGFIEWLKSKNYPVAEYASRSIFGEYSREKLEASVKKHENSNLIFHEVKDVKFDSDTARFTLTSDYGSKDYNYVFLTIGMLKYSDPYNLEGTPGYIQDPYPIEETLDSLNGVTGIIGTGLSAIDCIRYLLLENKKEKVYVFSRSGEMPSVRGEYADIKLKHFTKETLQSLITNDEIPLTALKQLFFKEMEANAVDYSLLKRRTGNTVEDLIYDIRNTEKVGRLHYLIMALNPVFSEIFQYLSRADKQKFMDEYHPIIDENHSPMPKEAASKLIEWIEAGKLVIVDDMEDVEKGEDFLIRTSDGESYRMDALINATGPVKSISRDLSGLTGVLRNHLLIGENEFGGIMVDRNRNVISPNIGTIKGMFALGMLTTGADYMANSVWLLVRNAKKLSDQLYSQLN